MSNLFDVNITEIRFRIDSPNHWAHIEFVNMLPKVASIAKHVIVQR